MNKIYKYRLTPTTVSVNMPAGAKLLHVGVQGEDDVFVWALVDTHANRVERRIYVVGTGHQLPRVPGDYVGTVMLSGGSLVFHVFDLGDTAA